MDAEGFVATLKDLGMPVFSLSVAEGIMQKSYGYTRLYVNRLCKKGAINMVEGGKYCLPGTDEYTIASRIVPYSYITGYAALGHYKLTTQIATKLQVVSPKHHRPMKLPNYIVEFSKVKREFIYGYAVTANGPILAEPEKIFIDDVYLHRKQYYSEEFDYAMESNKINLEKLDRYARMSGAEYVRRIIAKRLEPFGRATWRSGKKVRV